MTSEFVIAVHAMVLLAHRASRQTSAQLAANICTNPVRVRRVMAKLVHGGLATAADGTKGGYGLARPPGTITVDQVARATATAYVGTDWRSGDHDMACVVASGMGGVVDGLIGRMNQACSTEMEKTTIADIERQLVQRRKIK